MSTTKRCISLLLAVLMVLGMIPASVMASGTEALTQGETLQTNLVLPESDSIVDSGMCGENVYYTLYDSGLLEIKGSGAMYDYDLSYDDEGYAEVSHPWIDYYDISAIMICEGITSVGDFAFYGLNMARSFSVSVPQSVTNIGYCAFSSNNGLTGIYVHKDNPSYSNDENGVLFDKNKTILIQAPGGISGDYTIPGSVTTIGNDAFWECMSLTGIKIPDSVTIIGDNAFFWCRNLTNVSIPDSVETIGLGAFWGCAGLTDVIIPDSVITVGEQAFRYCEGLSSATIGNSVTSIGYETFGWCQNLKTVKFRGNAPRFSEYPFSEVNATVYYPTNNPTWNADVMQDYGGNLTWVPYTPDNVDPPPPLCGHPRHPRSADGYGLSVVLRNCILRFLATKKGQEYF